VGRDSHLVVSGID
jgi:hypothetical protein